MVYKESEFKCTWGDIELISGEFENITPKRLWYKVLSSNDKTTRVEVYTNNHTASMEFYNDSASLKAMLESEPTEESPFTIG